ncbi:NEK protein kinase [Cladophialophora psammophila CBS 110553]|uniref:non-specific serine/threonine protein kinase n=1 Tax=Cladophialophora psammophila CBS 110553 TaxID=1182543 RepID=W9X784_9EURO|nr:NEK protein kinase [Cladophialophora psammophila CBS 110553]EXJ73195.1 NEK protein kinase [Cladophialophora psammophila CBS 110553]
MALDDFLVDWDPNADQSFFSEPEQRNPVAESPIKHFFTWKEETRSTPWSRSIGERFRHLFFSNLDLPDENEWRFERPLGKGAFGAAALFFKRNERQEKIDALALKVTDFNPSDFVPAPGKQMTLTHEAAIMAQTNDLESDSLVRLRQYKVDLQYNRYYIEYCEFGTLETLRLRYKAWNKYLPEAFLWHTFYYLAKAYLDFCTGSYRSLLSSDFGQAPPGEYLLHNDIKTDNIFLAMNTDEDDGTFWYPIPKIGDFGLAMTINPDELVRGTAAAIQRGTELWQPPEQRIKYMTAWHRYHFGDDVDPRFPPNTNPALRRIRPEANIWAIGAVMWSLMTLEEIDELSDRVIDILMGEGPAWLTFGGTNVLDRADPEIRKRYSPELFELIQECTSLRPGSRPPPSRLLQDVLANMEKCFEQEEEMFRHTNDRAPITVAFAQDHFNDLPDGGANLNRQCVFWDDFADHLLWDKKEWDFVCPPAAPRELNFDDSWPRQIRERLEERWKEAVLRRDRGAAQNNDGGGKLSGQQETLPRASGGLATRSHDQRIPEPQGERPRKRMTW